MPKTEFTKLYNHMEKRFAGVDERFDALHREVAEVKAAVFETAAALKDHLQETTVLNRILDRHDKWIHKLANKTDTRLNY